VITEGTGIGHEDSVFLRAEHFLICEITDISKKTLHYQVHNCKTYYLHTACLWWRIWKWSSEVQCPVSECGCVCV